MAGATGLSAPAGAPASAQLMLTGGRGYLLAPGGKLISGPVTSPARWRPVSTSLGVPATLPCAPGGAETGGHALQAMLASTGPGWPLLCAGQGSGNSQVKTLYYSADRGRSWASVPGLGAGRRHVAIRDARRARLGSDQRRHRHLANAPGTAR